VHAQGKVVIAMEHNVEVGTVFAGCPPPGSERAGLPHSALVSGDDVYALIRIRLADTRIG